MAKKPQMASARPPADVLDLRRRLEEAEQTLEAIRSGNVDALVIYGAEGTRVFTLEGEDYRYRRLVETMNEGAALLSRDASRDASEDGSIEYANGRLAGMLGVGLPHLIGASLGAFVDAESRPTFQALLREGARSSSNAEICFRRGKGRVHTYVSATPTGDSDGGLCVVVTDLTEQKRGEEILAAERLATSILEQAAEAVVVCSPEGRVVRASRAAHKLAGDNPLFRPFATVFEVYLAGGKGCDEIVLRALRGERISGAEGTLAAANGEARVLVVSAAPLANAHQEIIGCVVSLTDVTERKCADAKLIEVARREKVRIEEANRAKDEFLAAVSHELRTPLNAILGWSRILRSGGLAEDKRDRALETIERNAVMQAQLVDDLLDISRIVSGNLRIEKRDVDVTTVVQAAIDAVKPLAQAKDVALQATLGPAPGFVLGDASRLQQVVWNLVTNAVKFTAKGGHVHVKLATRRGHVVVDVEDDGRGISEDFLPHVFERFRQAEGGITRGQGGLGIGLTIVKDLVALHGGTVTAHSDGEGRGARFTVTLPCAPASLDGQEGEAAETVESFEVSDQLSGARLLVVDDDDDGREIVAEVLRECQADVQTADSAHSAFSILQTEHFDALLSDISMPGEDGYSLIGRVRSLPPERNGRIPAVALTAFARAEDRRRALVAGFNGHIPKPIEPRRLVHVLSTMIRR
jgi:signal transduction histidine kinase/ActR/RegA family two-component response regulator